MSAPSAAVACVSWLKNPSDKGRSEVKISTLTKRKFIYLSFSAVAVTFVFYFILRYFDTENLLISTLSVTTSFLASMLLIFRSPFYAVAYAANDVILIILWTLASFEDVSYLSVVVCFSAFLLNDIYGFISWRRMEKAQRGMDNE
jgi:nicotinamide mononucleotide transporter PnuC